MARKRIDWDEEIRKTETIRRKGILMSILSFAVAVALIFGMGRFTGADIEIPRTVLVAAVFCISCILFAIIMKRRRKHND